MVSYIQANSTTITDFATGSVTNVILNSIAVAADMLNAAIFNVQKQAYLSTATGTFLDLKAADYNVIRKSAVAATGPFNFVKNTAANTNIDIPAGSLASIIPSPNSPVIQYETLADATLAIGSTSVAVQVQCTTPGVIGNIPAGTQLVLASAVPGIDGVTITADLTNGIDSESDDDLRARAKDSFKGLPIGTRGWYQSQALSVAGVASVSVVGQYSGQPNGVGIYITGPNNTIPSSMLITEVQDLFNSYELMIDEPTVLAPAALAVSGTITIKVLPGNDETAVSNAVASAVAAFNSGLGLGAAATDGWIYISDWITTAKQQTGVADAYNVTINGGTAAVAVATSQLPTCSASEVVVTPTT